MPSGTKEGWVSQEVWASMRLASLQIAGRFTSSMFVNEAREMRPGSWPSVRCHASIGFAFGDQLGSAPCAEPMKNWMCVSELWDLTPFPAREIGVDGI
jgi:hypothetical protein